MCKYQIELIHKCYLINKQVPWHTSYQDLPPHWPQPDTVCVFGNANSDAHDITCSNTSYKCWCPAPLFHTPLELHQQEWGAAVYCSVCRSTAQCEQENSVTATEWEMFLSHDVGYWQKVPRSKFAQCRPPLNHLLL